MKFIHCADVHLDTPLQGLAQYPGAPINEIRNARRAFEKVLDAAVFERVDFLIIAGDLYDTGLKSFESALFFNKQMARLKDAGIDVYLIYRKSRCCQQTDQTASSSQQRPYFSR